MGNIYYLVGNSYFETEHYSDARRLFGYALEHNAGNELYYRDYAITLAKLGQPEEAERQLEEAIGLGLSDDSLYMAQGEIAHVRGEYDKALECLNKAIVDTSDMQIRRRAIMISVDVCRSIGGDAVDQEIILLERYIDQFTGNGNMVMTEYLAEAYTRKAQLDDEEASQYYKKALELFQSLYDQGYVTYQLQQNMGILYEYMEQFDQAELIFMQLASQYP